MINTPLESPLARAYRWHRANPVGAHEVGKEATIAFAAAKAELAAAERGWIFNWINDGDEEGWTCVCYDAAGGVLAALGGIDDEDEASDRLTRAWQAAVAVMALWVEPSIMVIE